MRASLIVLAAALVASAVGCANNNSPPKVVSTTSAPMARAGVNISPQIVALCKIKFNDADTAPKFDYGEAGLAQEDRNVLEQVAKCMTSGALKMKRLALMGRADMRGEEEFNMLLGTQRVAIVRDYLTHLGVPMKDLIQTSRGSLDAEGRDEEGFRRDRRVDLLLIY
jgi:peptidoglycan-associated lipoprotein